MPKLDNKLYDILKWIAILFLPYLATFIAVVFAIWGIPYGEQIKDTIIAMQAFLGGILGLSAISYHKGNNGE